MMEQWNTGMVGLKEFLTIKIRLFSSLFPIFQYSNIPLFHAGCINQEPLKDL
jgi:hypothetical protein